MTAPDYTAREPVKSERAAKPLAMLQQIILVGLLLFEVVVFSFLGTHFFEAANLLQILRVSTELGLVSLAMTTVIVTGGIDLSVGSMLGLSAVVFGILWQDHGVPWPIAAIVAMLLGGAGGALNAAMITRLRIHPLIVTLATFSLYRGIANGLTGGVENFTGFPASFLFLGQGTIARIPVQAPVLIAVSIGFYLLLHRSVLGRSWSVIGYAPEGARYAGIPVRWRTAVPYILSGLMASAAALIYTARQGQVKSDAGTDYELQAITAVVLGGTSIFGGRGTVVGTLLGLCAIAVLTNGMQMSDNNLQPELAGIFTSVLLLVATGLDHHLRGAAKRTATPMQLGYGAENEEPIMRNSQLAVLCGVILIAAMVVVGGNYMVLKPEKPAKAEHPITVGMMPKDVGNAYFIACKKGAADAAGELGVKMLWDGPNGAQPGKQNEIVENWINRKVDVIAVSVDNAKGLATALKKARDKGIKVITWDADAPDSRDFFVNQATAEGIGDALMDNAAKVMGGNGKFAVITASLTAANQNEWLKYIEQRRAEKYPDIPAPEIEPCDDQQKEAFDQAKAIMNAHPDVKLILAISSVAVPAAAEAIKQSGRTDIHVVGLGLPNENKKYVHDGFTPALILWNTGDLGYLTIYASAAAANGTLKPGSTTLEAGRLGTMKVIGTDVMLGEPFVFNKDNIDQFDF